MTAPVTTRLDISRARCPTSTPRRRRGRRARPARAHDALDLDAALSPGGSCPAKPQRALGVPNGKLGGAERELRTAVRRAGAAEDSDAAKAGGGP